MPTNFYFSPLKPGSPDAGMGAYELGTGKLLFYSDGGKWFYAAGTGRAAFYVDGAGVHWLPR